MTRVLALADHSKIGCITQRRFAKVGTKTHPQRGAALDRNGLSVSTETACRFEPKSPVGNSEICSLDSGGDGNRTFEAYRQDLPRGGYESPGRNNSERIVASKMNIPEGRARNRRAKAE